MADSLAPQTLGARFGARTVPSELPAIEVAPLDERLGKRTGVLLSRARTDAAIDAALVLLATDGDVILTSDPDDLAALAATSGVHVDVVSV
jgi:hypothetical protein